MTAITYTLEAALVAMYLLIRNGRTPSVRAVLSCLLNELTPAQRELLGMAPGVPEALEGRLWDDEYGRFHKWFTRALVPMDSGFDLPAQRISTAAHQRQVAGRSAEERRRSRLAERLGTALINDLIAASVLEACPDGYRGDVVADETIINVSDRNKRTAEGEWTRSAVYAGSYYNQSRPDDDGKPKKGHGIGVTAVVRVGPPDAMHTIVPVVTGISVNRPSSGTPAFLDEALAQHRSHGFDARRTGRNAAYPYCVTDMGYTAKTDYAGILYRRQYAQISRFPKHHNHVHVLPGPRGEETGVVQMAGDVYCPAAQSLIAAKDSLIIGTAGLDEPAADRHDRILQQTHPLLMGRNSRLRQAGAPGRPPKGRPVEKKYRIELVCPAVQGRVRCPLKPDSMDLIDPGSAPQVDPSWTAREKSACSKSSVVVEFPDMAFRQFHGTLPASAWEHTFLYESYRSMTERTFSVLKSRHVTPCQRLDWAPKREPYLLLVIAMSIAVMNLRVQASGPYKNNPNTFRRNMADLEAVLGRKPMKVPPRT